MKKSGKCPKCGSAKVVENAKMIDRGHFDAQREMTVATFRSPDAFILKGQRQTTVSAWVCGGCGYVELYADEPRAIDVGR